MYTLDNTRPLSTLQNAHNLEDILRHANRSEYMDARTGKWERINCIVRIFRAIFSAIMCGKVYTSKDAAINYSLGSLGFSYNMMLKNPHTLQAVPMPSISYVEGVQKDQVLPQKFQAFNKIVLGLSRSAGLIQDQLVVVAREPVKKDAEPLVAGFEDHYPHIRVTSNTENKHEQLFRVVLLTDGKPLSLNFQETATFGHLKNMIIDAGLAGRFTLQTAQGVPLKDTDRLIGRVYAYCQEHHPDDKPAPFDPPAAIVEPDVAPEPAADAEPAPASASVADAEPVITVK